MAGSNNNKMLAASAVVTMALVLLASSAPTAFAQTCDADTVEVEIPYFGPRDVVEECMNDPKIPDWHCPTPFPEFPHTADIAPNCEVAVIGAGTGGLYAAMRLIETSKVKGPDVCIFESTDRVGGRIYSLRGMGPKKDLTVDAGGYRTWPRYTPVTHELITKTLNLSMDCYEPETPCQKFNIVDKNGNKDGFATMPEELMRRVMKTGARFFKNSELIGMNKTLATDPVTVLFFKSGIVSKAKHVLLGVPQRPLLQIIRESNLPAGVVDTEMYQAMHSVQTEIVTKLYIYYKDAWWLKLNLTVGDIRQDGDTQNMLLAGRYHDGHVNCDKVTKECHGFLMTVYANDYAGDKAQYFRRFQSDRGEPVTIISGLKSIEHKSFLQHAHQQLITWHKSGMPYAMKQEKMSHLGAYQIEQILNNAPAPDFAVLATWNTATYGAGGGWHGWTNLAHQSRAKQPLNVAGIHLINEAFSNVQGWAEGSLQLADTVLKQHFNIDPPWPFAVPDSPSA